MLTFFKPETHYVASINGPDGALWMQKYWLRSRQEPHPQMNHASENAMDQLIIDTMKQQCPDVRLIYLFGSRVGNLAREDSDWDIAILCARPLDQIQRWQLGETMAQKLHQDVDLVDLATASTVLRMEILQHGRVLFDTPPSADEFAMTTISMYQHLQSERADILADFYQRMTP